MGFLDNLTGAAEGASFIDKAKKTVEDLVASGKLQDAVKYLDQARPTVQAKFPSLLGAFDKIKDLIPKH